jgi:hypothetical protein
MPGIFFEKRGNGQVRDRVDLILVMGQVILGNGGNGDFFESEGGRDFEAVADDRLDSEYRQETDSVIERAPEKEVVPVYADMPDFPFGYRGEGEQLLLETRSESFSDGFGGGSLEDAVLTDRDDHGFAGRIEDASAENFEDGHGDECNGWKNRRLQFRHHFFISFLYFPYRDVFFFGFRIDDEWIEHVGVHLRNDTESSSFPRWDGAVFETDFIEPVSKVGG